MEQNREPGLTAVRPQCGKILAWTKDPEVKLLYTPYAAVFVHLDWVQYFRIQTLYYTALHVQAREEGRGEAEAAAAALIRGPAHRDPSTQLPSSGEGQR